MSEVKIVVSDISAGVNICDQEVVVLSGNDGPQGPRGTQVLSGSTDPSVVIGLIGDQYLNTTTGYLFGPKTESGWGSGVLLGTGLKISDVSYTHYQTIVSNTWSITYSLGFTPNIIIVDLDGNVIEGDYEYNGNTIIANFSDAIAGAAYLS